jgi:Domain of unknown function (DUF4186)
MPSSAIESIDARLDALATQRFRAGFHLRDRERALVRLRGMQAIRRHAEELIAARVAPVRSRRPRPEPSRRTSPA